jgi:phosphate transport system protein
MATRVHEMLAGSLQALAGPDADRGRWLIGTDAEINRLEVEIDERCLKLLARWQPVASDLRFVATALKLVTDLERIGDNCVNLCQRVLELEPAGLPGPPNAWGALATAVEDLLGAALAALRAEDATLAAQVIEGSSRVDALANGVTRACFEANRDAGDRVTVTTRLHEVPGYLQRIAAHATNIAEMVIFLVRGEDVRHGGTRGGGAAGLPSA